jgi:hypothetical protein
VGLPIAVVPGFVHGDLGYSAVLAGLAVSIQYPGHAAEPPVGRHAVRYAGPKRSVLTGLMLCAGSGVLTLIAAQFAGSDWLGWVAAGGAPDAGRRRKPGHHRHVAWGIGSAGARHTAKVISWNGITTYGALAVGAPVVCWPDSVGSARSAW